MFRQTCPLLIPQKDRGLTWQELLSRKIDETHSQQKLMRTQFAKMQERHHDIPSHHPGSSCLSRTRLGIGCAGEDLVVVLLMSSTLDFGLSPRRDCSHGLTARPTSSGRTAACNVTCVKSRPNQTIVGCFSGGIPRAQPVAVLRLEMSNSKDRPRLQVDCFESVMRCHEDY